MQELYDVIVIGGGPAGLTAALYLARAKYRVLVLEKERFGGQIAITEEVVNYPGVERISGRALTDTMRRQAESFGAEFLLAEATALELGEDVKTVVTTKGTLRCLGVLLASGAHPRAVGFRGEEAHKGRGVAYCATCDGEFFTDKEVFVVGGGYAAAEESVFLTKFARHVTILIRRDDFSCAASVAEKAKRHEKITVLTNTVVEEVDGEAGLTYLRYRNTKTGEVTEYRAAEGDHFGVFVLAGYAPDTALVEGLAERNEQGYVVTDGGQRTSAAGLYAAGDVCIKPLRQVATAVGDGALAATELEKYVAAMQRKTGLQGNAPAAPKPVEAKSDVPEADTPFDGETRRQLQPLFEKMPQSMLLRLELDERPVSRELETYMTALAALTDKLTVTASPSDRDDAPCVRICHADGTETGLAFHGVPAGHEFTSFALGLYHAAGGGQPMEEGLRQRIATLQAPTALQVLVTLGCTLCPELVTAAQRIAAENPHVTAEVYDIRHFEALRQRHQVMSVPCLVVNGEAVSFGKKSLEQVLTLLGV